MYPSTIRQRIANNELLLSTAMFTREPHVAAAIYQTGPDWVWFDHEHTPWGAESIGLLCVMARQAGVAGVIRVPWNTPGDIKKAYDVGAVGVMVPQVDTPEEVRDAVSFAKYPPLGERGIAPWFAAPLGVEPAQVIAKANDETMQKTYLVQMSGTTVTPAEVIAAWKENFAAFWPKGSRFYAPLTGIAPGEVALLNLTAPGGMPLSTGVMVIYADDESFTFMCPEGHMFSGWITFSAYEQDGCSVAQAQVLIRANDPLWEIVMRLYGFKKEDTFWNHTMESLAQHFGVAGQVQVTSTRVDPRMQWSQAKNVWHNAAIRSGMYTMATPLRWVRNLVPRR